VTDADRVTELQPRFPNSRIVDKRPVRGSQILDEERLTLNPNATMDAGDSFIGDLEIGLGGTTDGQWLGRQLKIHIVAITQLTDQECHNPRLATSTLTKITVKKANRQAPTLAVQIEPVRLQQQMKVGTRNNCSVFCLTLLSGLVVFLSEASFLLGDTPGLVKQLNDQLANVSEQVSEAVVVISVDKMNWGAGDDSAEMPNDFYRDYGNSRRGSPRRKLPEGQGSGFILRKDGFILTNNHVVESAAKIMVRLKDGRTFPATVKGIDDKTDLAVIKIDAKDLPTVRLGNSDNLRVGEFAIAIGTPYSLDYSVTVGVISQKHRSGLGMASYEDYIQTDAKINPGNSGGPLVNIDGEVIGVNTLIRGLRTDIGFAIPINMAKDIADKLITQGKVVRPWVGVGFKYLSNDKDLMEYLHGNGNEVVVDMLHPNAPASASPLRPADIIVAVNGTTIHSPKDVQNEVIKKKVGENVVFSVLRDGKPIKIEIKTKELPTESIKPPPAPPAPSSETPRRERKEDGIGLAVQPLSKVPVEQFDVKNVQGVFISGTDMGGLADQAGLQHGDIIIEVNRKAVQSVEEYKEVLAKADLKLGVLIFFNRQGSISYALVKRVRED